MSSQVTEVVCRIELRSWIEADGFNSECLDSDRSGHVRYKYTGANVPTPSRLSSKRVSATSYRSHAWSLHLFIVQAEGYDAPCQHMQEVTRQPHLSTAMACIRCVGLAC